MYPFLLYNAMLCFMIIKMLAVEIAGLNHTHIFFSEFDKDDYIAL